MSQPSGRSPGQPDPLDPGGSEARDVLGWQRTTLAMMAVGAGSAKHTWSTLGVYALVPLGLMVLVATWVTAEGWRRYDEDREGVEQSGGVPTFLLAATVAAVAGVGVVYLLRR